MRRSRSVAVGTLAFVLLLAASTRLTASEPDAHIAQPRPTPAVTLRAASGGTVRFTTHNGETVDGVPPQARDLPHLVLHRNGALTAPAERTLIVEVAGIEVPPSGVTITLEVTTQHVDPDTRAGLAEQIRVWREARRITSTNGPIETVSAVVFTRTFSETVSVDGREVPTPTDYFGYTVTIASAEGDGGTPLAELVADHALLMENQVVTLLPGVREESEGAAPDELVVHYCDMVPFQRDGRDASTRLPREKVSEYVHATLVPAMVEAFRVQSDVWGFTWHEAWTSYRGGKDAERLSVALTDGQTWFHGSAPRAGSARISLNVNGGSGHLGYGTHTDALVGTFHHELFHNLQRSINQHNGGDGRVGGESDAWEFFSEGTAGLASSVGVFDSHVTQGGRSTIHIRNANLFLSRNSHTQGKTTAPVDGSVTIFDDERMAASSPVDAFGVDARSYEAVGSYHALAYWRFLYERCSGMQDGREDSAAGMEVIRYTLSVLYSGDIVDVASSTDLLENLPRIMDSALARSPSCPFRTYEASVVHYARAIYALRLDGGRCLAPGVPSGCGFYDPNGLYVEPAVHAVVYLGADLQVLHAIRKSYGMAFIDVIVDASTHGQPLVLEIEPAPEGSAEFSVQVWRLVDAGPDAKPRPVPEQVAGPELVGTAAPGGRVTYTIPAIDVTAYSRLGLIITRVDANERSDPLGRYTIRLLPG